MLEGIRVKDWTQKDRQTNKVLAFSLWNGNISVQVYDAQNMKNKSFRKNLTDENVVVIEKLFNKVVAASPETKSSIQFTKYDPQSKQFKIDAVFTFEKDSKQCYRITVTDANTQSSNSFVLRASATMTMGSDPLSDANLSAIKLDTLKDWITNAKIWGPATYQPIDRSKFGNRGGYGGGGSAPVSHAAEAPSDGGGVELPF